MKNKISFRRIMSVALVAAGLSVLIVSCKKDLEQTTPVPASGLMVLNLAPDQNALGVALSGSMLSPNPLGYTGFNGNYQNIYAGQREVAVYDYMQDSIISKSNFDFKTDELYSLFVTGNKGVYAPVIVKDDLDSAAAADKAYIRYINAIPDSTDPVITMNAAGTDVFNEAAAFKSVSAFEAVNEGNITITAKNGASINASRTIAVQKGWVYTFLVIGDPTANEEAKKVQIRYIQNGIVPAASDK